MNEIFWLSGAHTMLSTGVSKFAVRLRVSPVARFRNINCHGDGFH